MTPHETPSVSIDGHAIRRIREEKRLTQLYVAKVVGVTTDTVSRWENNRYPTIRRDNAINLAEALEVELGEILKRDEEPVAEVAEPPKKNLWPLAVLFVLLVIGAGWFIYQQQAEPLPVIKAERLQPQHAAPGSRILVRLQVDLEAPLKGMIVKEQFPAGWTLIDAVPPVSSLGKQGNARWMLRNPARQTTIAYLLEVDPAATSGATAQINGEVIANPDGQRSSVPISASGSVQISPLHWVDSDGNHVIDDMEILEVSDLFEDTDELSNEWEQIEEIWDAGGYRWDEGEGRFVPSIEN